MKTYEISAGAALAAISAVVQIIHIGYLIPNWGMWIDIVAIPWILAFFLYREKMAFSVSVIGAIIITLVDPSSWLGASMKWLATMPMWLMLLIWQRLFKLKLNDYRKISVLISCIIFGIILRGIIIIPLNYYYAIPIWTGMTSEQALAIIPWWIIFSVNAIQGILEVTIAWLLVFKFKLQRYATWK
jgi:riboflavin transporter FmnP